MDIVELQNRLQNLICENISQTELGIAMGDLKRQTVHTRIKNNSEVTVSELLNAQKYFGKKLVLFTDEKNTNTLQPKDNEQILKNYEFFGHRLAEVQEELGYLDKAMARVMGIDEKRYIRIKLGKEDATTEQLVRLASKVDVSLDWLVKGE